MLPDAVRDLQQRHAKTTAELGQVVIFFDHRMCKTLEDQFSTLQSYMTAGLCRLGWPSVWRSDLEPGTIRLLWYTHAGNQGQRDYPLHRAYTVKDMFDSLSASGFRPMVIGWSGENPFPMIGGSEPPPEPKKPKVQKTTTWSGAVSGHSKDGTTPHDRVMKIIDEEERKEAEERRKEVEGWENEKGGFRGLV